MVILDIPGTFTTWVLNSCGNFCLAHEKERETTQNKIWECFDIQLARVELFLYGVSLDK